MSRPTLAAINPRITAIISGTQVFQFIRTSEAYELSSVVGLMEYSVYTGQEIMSG
jgi:hypothetical protein